MNAFLKSFFLYLFVGLLASSCESNYDSLVNERMKNNPTPKPVSGDPGSADFSKYVAIGDSWAAGFMDGALYNKGQQNSLPAQIAKQLQLTGAPGTFNQPDINSELGFNTVVENPQNGTVLGRFKLDISIPGPSPTVGGDLIAPFSGNVNALQNFGVPGIVLGQLLTPATGGPQSELAFNPFYARFASSPGSSTILGDAIAAQPTFFTLWIGTNDVLGYALSGGSNPDILTTESNFSTQFTAVASQLIGSTSASGVVANIPPFLGLAFFRALPYNPIPLDAQTAGQLNAAYTGYNNGLQQAFQGGLITQDEAERRTISFQEGNNAYVMNDETLTDLSALGLPSIRQSEPSDLQILSLASVLGEDLGNGPVGLQDPVTDNFVLIPEEQREIETSRNAFNEIIRSVVEENASRLALYDMNDPSNSFLDLLGISDSQPGITINGVALQPDFSPNGILSTDGIHPNARGTAIFANDILRVIEANFGADIPPVDVLNLPSVQLCAGDCASQQ